MSKLSEKVKAGRSALLGRTVRDLSTWNNRALVSQNNSSRLYVINGRTVRTWTTYRSAKNPGRSVVQGHKNTCPCPNSIQLMRTVRPLVPDGPRRETKTRCQQTSLTESRMIRSSGPDGLPTIEMIFLRLFKRIYILKPEVLLALMQMLLFILYKALSFTPNKFIDPS
jgi:hypothetical protein